MRSFYCTIIDINFLARALCLYRSLAPWLGEKTFAFYCIDNEPAAILESLSLDKAWVVRRSEFETSALRKARQERAVDEYCWTCKPAILQHALSADSRLDWAVYLDADTMVFGDPDAALLEATDANAVITPHRFATTQFLAEERAAGSHNGGYAAYRHSREGKRALQWWLDRCLELCPNVPVGMLYADQKYLDQLSEHFPGVKSSPHKGLNAAPWNIENKRIAKLNGRIYIDEDELLLYHFQGSRIYGPRLYDLYVGPMKIPADAVHLIYRPYIRSLRRSFEILRSVSPGFRHGITPLLRRPRFFLSTAKRLLTSANNLALA